MPVPSRFRSRPGVAIDATDPEAPPMSDAQYEALCRRLDAYQERRRTGRMLDALAAGATEAHWTAPIV